jgi:hypothetical protein
MNNLRKNFIYKNEAFECLNCKFLNGKGEGFIRNHCSKCLYSLHVDEVVPGDRESSCLGLMYPEAVFMNSKKGWTIVHKCLKCAKIINNMIALDDDIDLIAKISSKGYDKK